TQARELPPVGPAPEADVEAARRRMSPTLADVVQVQLLTAMRPGEALGLRPCDLDRSGEGWVYRPPSHKTQHHGRDRVILIGPQAQEVLLRNLPLCEGPEDYVFSPRRSMRDFRERQRAARKTPVQPSQVDRSKARPRKGPGARYRVTSYS